MRGLVLDRETIRDILYRSRRLLVRGTPLHDIGLIALIDDDGAIVGTARARGSFPMSEWMYEQNRALHHEKRLYGEIPYEQPYGWHICDPAALSEKIPYSGFPAGAEWVVLPDGIENDVVKKSAHNR